MDINDMTRPHGVAKGITVEQLRSMLGGMPSEMEVVVEGSKLIDAHCILDVLPPEGDEGDSEAVACNTVVLTVGSKWEYSSQDEPEE